MKEKLHDCYSVFIFAKFLLSKCVFTKRNQFSSLDISVQNLRQEAALSSYVIASHNACSEKPQQTSNFLWSVHDFPLRTLLTSRRVTSHHTVSSLYACTTDWLTHWPRRLGHARRKSWLRLFVFFPSSSRRISGSYFGIGHDPFLQHPFPINHSTTWRRAVPSTDDVKYTVNNFFLNCIIFGPLH
jgi:hypothetical protein